MKDWIEFIKFSYKVGVNPLPFFRDYLKKKKNGLKFDITFQKVGLKEPKIEIEGNNIFISL